MPDLGAAKTSLIMKFLITVLSASFFALSALAGTTAIEGDIILKYTKSSFSDEVFKKEFGGVVKASVKWHVADFFGEETVHAGISAENTGAKPMYFHYYVAFFDKDKKLVGSAGQGGFEALKRAEKCKWGHVSFNCQRTDTRTSLPIRQ
jgi:hypothetical protein